MVYRDPASIISTVPLFSGLNERELKSFLSRVRTQHYRAGEVIFHKDDPGDTFHLILDGLVKIYLASEDGQEPRYGPASTHESSAPPRKRWRSRHLRTCRWWRSEHQPARCWQSSPTR